jgi:hypothetical protein
MLEPSRSNVRTPTGLPALALTTLLVACGGGAAATPPSPEPAPTQAPTRPSPAIPLVRTDTVPGQIVKPQLFGVDLDTVHAGQFDQGKMWTFEFPPIDYFARTYGFRPDSAWFAHARLGALRIPSCSASFVSPNGLVMTNHHCAREFVTQVQKEGEDLLDNGFFAQNLEDERPVKDFHADQLVDILDVTDEVNRQVDQVPMDKRADTRKDVLDEIQKRITGERGGEGSGIVVEMVSLYNGGRTSAYVFHRYTNAKLVMAPEVQIGFFGGDPDNFTYPRYNLDFSFFRIYDDQGNPLKSGDYFKVDDDGLREEEPIFIVGNPGSTSRLQTVAELEFRRDVSDRDVLALLRSRMAVLKDYMDTHPDVAKARDLENQYFELSNSEKAYAGQIRGLEDPVIIARRQDSQNRFQKAIEADSSLARRYGDLIQRMAGLQDELRQHKEGFGAFLALTNDQMSSATLYRALLAFQILNVRRGGGPQDQLDTLMTEFKAVPDQPAELDEGLMAARFRDFIDYYGRDAQFVQNILQGRSPEGAATVIREGSALADSAGAVEAIQGDGVQMTDPAMQVVRGYLPPFIQFQQAISGVFPQEEEISAQLGRARFEVYGTAVPPDATFSLRIADGVVKGYPYNGTIAPWHTTLYGMYNRHFSFTDRHDWELPARWVPVPSGLDLATPLDFVSTADIIGGNSGSPVLDKDLDVVGVVFDGNIESLPGDYIYLPETNRAVAVDIHGILEALDVVYDMDRIVLELKTGRLARTEAEADRVGR